LTLQARDLASGALTSTKMMTLQTPKSFREGLEAAMTSQDVPQGRWFTSFAKRILGK